MATVKYVPAVFDDLDRLSDFLRESDAQAAEETAALILDSIRILRSNPLIGRPIGPRRRELVIFRGRTGYLAQYAYRWETDEVIILAIRHQREAGD